MALTGLLPPLVFGMLAMVCAGRLPRGGAYRSAMLVAAAGVALWAVLGVELLGALHQLRRGPVVAWWGAGIAAVMLMVMWRRPKGHDAPTDCKSAVAGTLRRRLPLALGLLAIASVLGTTFYIAITTPPNTWDTLQYHLARVVYWLQQGHAGHFPAGDLRLLEMPPMAEYAAAHILLLTGQDRWVNLIQWSALGLCACAASLIARELALLARRDDAPSCPTHPAEILAALLTVTIPAAATQSVNGKNDIVVALWLMVALWIALRAWRTRTISTAQAGLAGAAIALAVLTKGTAYIYGLPVCVLLGVAILRARGMFHSVRPGLVIVGIVLAVNGPFVARNYVALGSPISLSRERGGFPIKMEDHSPRAVASNIVRNVTIHTSTPWPRINDGQQRIVGALHEMIGQPLSAPETTLRRHDYRVVSTWHSDGNNPAPLHLLLAFGLIAAAARRPRRAWRDGLALAAAVPVVGFVLFCVLLVWQPWHARLHIPAFILVAPGAAWVVARAGAIPRVLVGLAAFALVWPAVLTNEAKPLIGPRSILRAPHDAVRFHQRPQEQRPVEAAAAMLAERAPMLVGLDLRRSPGTYSVQRALLDRLPAGSRLMEFRMRFGVPDPQGPAPDVVLSWRTHGRPIQIRDARGNIYSAFADFGALILYRPGEPDLGGTSFIGWGLDQGLFAGQGLDPAALLRWGFGPHTRLWFQAQEGPTELVLDLKPGNVPDQKLTIRLNREVLETIALPPGNFREIRRELPTIRGRNVLSLEYAGGEPTGLPASRAVLYRKIQLLPGSKLVAEPGGPAPSLLETAR
jgi:4-amino-4-deoxy-L-arabinose transferase-like glycosyltransferase